MKIKCETVGDVLDALADVPRSLKIKTTTDMVVVVTLEHDEALFTDGQEGHERASVCETCGYPLRPYNPGNTSTWRSDNFCSARCKRAARHK